LQERRRVLELAHVDPADAVAQALATREGSERERWIPQQLADGERHGPHCTVRTKKWRGGRRMAGHGRRPRWPDRTNASARSAPPGTLPRAAAVGHTRSGNTPAHTEPGGATPMEIAQERRLVTEIPGPRSRELLDRRSAAVPRGLGSSTPVFVDA